MNLNFLKQQHYDNLLYFLIHILNFPLIQWYKLQMYGGMGMTNIYKDIAERSGGDVYIGVVGPVRTGKSTFIKRFMDLLVIPNI